jgi:type VI secretion system secreted protein VgrG
MSWSPPSAAATFAEHYAPLFEGRERSIELTFPFPDEGGPPPGCVIAQRVEVTEALSTPFRITVHALGARYWYHKAKDGSSVHRGRLAHPEQFLGHRARVSVRGEDRERTFDGIVTATRHLGDWPFDALDEDGFQLVELTIESALALLAYRRTCRIFHDLCPLEVVQDVLHEHWAYNPRVSQALRDLVGAIPARYPRSYLTQYQESDLDLVQRLLANAGRHYLLPNDTRWDFGHQVELIAPESRLGREPELTLCGDGTTVSGLPLRHWHGHRALGIPRTRLSSPDYRGPTVHAEANGHDLRAFNLAAGEWGEYLPLPPNARPSYDPERPHSGRAPLFGDDAQARQRARDAAADRYEGETIAPLPLGGVIRVRALQPHRHSQRKPEFSKQPSDAYDYVVVGQTLIAHAPLHRDLHQRLAADLVTLDQRAGLDVFGRKDREGPRLRARFQASPIDQPLAPDPLGHPRKAPGALTGQVIGHPGDTRSVVHTDKLGRIGVTLDWQQPADHRLSGHSPYGPDGGPVTWLRYVQPGAGDGFGFQYLPRIGDEVLVLFLNDDPDRPVAVGSLYSPKHDTPDFGGVRRNLPENAALTGLRTREHRGSGHNELCMDDSPGEVGLRLASSTAATALTLGHIATPRKIGEATPRGTGVELRTDGAAALRAAQGVLLTTFNADKDAPHLAHEETRQLLTERKQLFDQLVQAMRASSMTAPSLQVPGRIEAALGSWSKHPDGQGQPSIVITSPDSLAAVTRQSQLLHAAERIDLAAGQGIQVHSGEAIQIASAEKLECFAAEGGIAVHAQSGDIAVTTGTDRIRVTSANDILLQALNGTLRLEAARIEIATTDGSVITLADAIRAASPGVVDMHGQDTRLHGPQAVPLAAPLAKTTDEVSEKPTYLSSSHQQEKR